MRSTILYFAAARDRAQCRSEILELPAHATAENALAEIARRHPALASLLPHLRLAVNGEFVVASEPLPDGAELALIPPVAGGAGRFRLSSAPLELVEVMAAVASLGQGGVVTFTGAVRNVSRGVAVLRLEYEAYETMAVKKLAQIGAEAEAKWPGVRVAITHRTGALLPGEAAVHIAASAPHRKEAFAACEYAIDRLKADVPIWKKEIFEDGQVWVGLGP